MKKIVEHPTYANPFLKAHTQSPTSGGMRERKRSMQAKIKSIEENLTNPQVQHENIYNTSCRIL